MRNSSPLRLDHFRGIRRISTNPPDGICDNWGCVAYFTLPGSLYVRGEILLQYTAISRYADFDIQFHFFFFEYLAEGIHSRTRAEARELDLEDDCNAWRMFEKEKRGTNNTHPLGLSILREVVFVCAPDSRRNTASISSDIILPGLIPHSGREVAPHPRKVHGSGWDVGSSSTGGPGGR